MTNRNTTTARQREADREATKAKQRKRRAMHELMRQAMQVHGPDARAQRYDTIMARAYEIEEGGK